MIPCQHKNILKPFSGGIQVNYMPWTPYTLTQSFYQFCYRMTLSAKCKDINGTGLEEWVAAQYATSRHREENVSGVLSSLHTDIVLLSVTVSEGISWCVTQSVTVSEGISWCGTQSGELWESSLRVSHSPKLLWEKNPLITPKWRWLTLLIQLHFT